MLKHRSEALILCNALRSWSHCGCSVTLLGQEPVWCFRKHGSMHVQLHDRSVNCYDKRRKSYWVHSKRWEKFSWTYPFQVAKFHSCYNEFANMVFWIFFLQLMTWTPSYTRSWTSFSSASPLTASVVWRLISWALTETLLRSSYERKSLHCCK